MYPVKELCGGSDDHRCFFLQNEEKTRDGRESALAEFCGALTVTDGWVQRYNAGFFNGEALDSKWMDMKIRTKERSAGNWPLACTLFGNGGEPVHVKVGPFKVVPQLQEDVAGSININHLLMGSVHSETRNLRVTTCMLQKIIVIDALYDMAMAELAGAKAQRLFLILPSSVLELAGVTADIRIPACAKIRTPAFWPLILEGCQPFGDLTVEHHAKIKTFKANCQSGQHACGVFDHAVRS